MEDEDIEKYGLFSYEEYEDKLSNEAFEMLNLRYMKVALGKGIITEKHRLYLREFFNGNSANFKSKFDLQIKTLMKKYRKSENKFAFFYTFFV